MNEYLSDKEIKESLQNCKKEAVNNKVINPIIMCYPYTEMEASQFELLTYCIFNADKEIYFPNKNVTVLKGNLTADKGKDVTIKNTDGKIIAIVQCKRYQSKLSITLLYDEIVKTMLNLIKDNEDISNFTNYYIVSPYGFNQDIVPLLPNAKKLNETEIDKSALKIQTLQEKLKILNYDLIKKDLYSSISKLSIKVITATDLDNALQNHVDICKMFFRVESVLDIKSFQDLFDEYIKKIETINKRINTKLLQDDYKIKKCQNCKAINLFYNQEPTDEYYKTNFNIIADELEKIRRPSREVLSTIMKIILKSPDKIKLECSSSDLQDELPRGKYKIIDRLENLKKFGFVTFNDYEKIEEIRIGSCDLKSPLYGKEEFFIYIIEFCKEKNIDIDKIFIEKDFTVFD